MAYPYNITRNGYSIPLTNIYSGYNSSGSTPGYFGMGSFSTTSVNYNKQNLIEYYYNGTSVFTSNICSSYTPPTTDTLYSGNIPGGCSSITFILIGGGGGSRGSDNINEVSGQTGGGGGFLFINCSCSSGMSYKIFSGSGGGFGNPSPFQSDGLDGVYSTLIIGGNTFTANGGYAGTFYGAGSGGSYSNPSTTGITVYQSYGGIGQSGVDLGNAFSINPIAYNGLQQNFSLMPSGEFDSSFNSYGMGGGIGPGSNGIAIMYFHY